MGKKKQNSNVTSESETIVEVPQAVETQKEQPEPTQRFVVVRDGHRVSDAEYQDQNDPAALAELAFWTKVANNHSWGEPVKIVQYDNKIHRVW